MITKLSDFMTLLLYYTCLFPSLLEMQKYYFFIINDENAAGICVF